MIRLTLLALLLTGIVVFGMGLVPGITERTNAFASASTRPHASCPASMVFEAASGLCKTPQTLTRSRPAVCAVGWIKVAGEFGGTECQRSVTTTVQTGTRRVYSHTSYTRVWIDTGTTRVHVRDERTWVPPRTITEPLVPPVRRQTGTTTRRSCSFDPFAGQQCWNERIPTYEWITTSTQTIPGRYITTPIYEERPTGYWHYAPQYHYNTVPVYETKKTWQTRPATLRGCESGWNQRGNQCERTVLGPPTTSPSLSCPASTRLVATSGGLGRECQFIDESVTGPTSTSPADEATPASDSDGAPDSNPSSNTGNDGLGVLLGALPDSELAKLGLNRCADGLLSYVACGSLPERDWEEDDANCDAIAGTHYSDRHGGTCVTKTDTLNKCVRPGDCEEVAIRTYCPAIAELATTEIRAQQSSRGTETFRVCVFVCDRFETIPAYVRQRILQSPDYACQDLPPIVATTVPSTTAPSTTVPTTTVPTTTAPRRPGPVPTTVSPRRGAPTTSIPQPTCDLPTLADLGEAAGDVVFASPLRRSASPDVSTLQRHLPGGGEYLIVAPGHGWLALRQGTADGHQLDVVDRAGCVWEAQGLQLSWRELLPWRTADRQKLLGNKTIHLLRQWDALSPQSQAAIRSWRGAGGFSFNRSCAVDAFDASNTLPCLWRLPRPAAYEWRLRISYRLDPHTPGTDRHARITLGSGVELIQPLGAYSAGQAAGARFGV